MKLILAFLAALALIVPDLQAVPNSYSLQWDAVPTATNYVVYRKAANGDWTAIGNPAGTTFAIVNPPAGQNVYAVTARSVTGLEGALSNSVTVDPVPGAPGNLKVITVQITIGQ